MLSLLKNRSALLTVPEPYRARRELALALVDEALRAVDAYAATSRALPHLTIPPGNKLHVLAFGKAAHDMARACLDYLPITGGVVIGLHAEPLGPLSVLVGQHPDPCDQAPQHAKQLLACAATLGPSDTALCLISGGGSALLELPRAGVSLGELRDTSRLLMRAGADIGQLNRVRQALSQVKGGGLLTALGGAHVVNLLLSDVIGGAPELIASGPTTQPSVEPSRAARDVIRRLGLQGQLAPRVRAQLFETQPAAPSTRRSPAPEQRIVADNDTARSALIAAARTHGIQLDSMPGHASGLTRLAARQIWAAAHQTKTPPTGLAWGGETLVRLQGPAGLGGRNQELALEWALLGLEPARTTYPHGSLLLPELAHHQDPIDQAGSGLFVSFGSDGVDGSSPAAGALIDGHSLAQLDPATCRDALTRHASYSLLTSIGSSLETGPTGTNVADLMFWLPGV